MRALALSLLTAGALAVSGCGGHTSQTHGVNAPRRGTQIHTITELTTIEQLRAQFNKQPDVPKLIVLMSPT